MRRTFTFAKNPKEWEGLEGTILFHVSGEHGPSRSYYLLVLDAQGG